MYQQHIILDFEMNPVAKKYATVRKQLHREIIEIGAVRLNSEGNFQDSFSCFIKPEFSADIATYITKLTGIKKADVYQADSFEKAVWEFSKWIGSGKTRIYSWSSSDQKQLLTECSFKQVNFPGNMQRWIDFQRVFPRLMELRQSKNLMSLHEAAEWYGISFNYVEAHRALYDAKITAELVVQAITGKYVIQRNCLKEILQGDETGEQNSEFSLEKLCDKFFYHFSINEKSEPKCIG